MGKRHKTESGGIDIKRMMKTFEGRWIYAPILVAFATMAAIALFSTLLKLDNALPSWAYTAPAVPTVGAYYALQVRRLWHTEIKTELNSTKNNVGAGHQSVKDSGVAPVIQGNNNVVNVVQAPPAGIRHDVPPAKVADKPALSVEETAFVSGLHQMAKERAEALVAKAPTPTPPSEVVTLTERPPTVPSIKGSASKAIHDAEVEVRAAGHESIELSLVRGQLLTGSILGSAPLNVYLMNERTYHQYWDSNNTEGAKIIEEDEASARIKWTVTRTGKWYLVLDTHRKKSDRVVKVRLEISETVPQTVS